MSIGLRWVSFMLSLRSLKSKVEVVDWLVGGGEAGVMDGMCSLLPSFFPRGTLLASL
jgi:hypothetical protein